MNFLFAVELSFEKKMNVHFCYLLTTKSNCFYLYCNHYFNPLGWPQLIIPESGFKISFELIISLCIWIFGLFQMVVSKLMTAVVFIAVIKSVQSGPGFCFPPPNGDNISAIGPFPEFTSVVPVSKKIYAICRVKSLLKAFSQFDIAGTQSANSVVDSPRLFQLRHADNLTQLTQHYYHIY